jgi:hypothetical protein
MRRSIRGFLLYALAESGRHSAIPSNRVHSVFSVCLVTAVKNLFLWFVLLSGRAKIYRSEKPRSALAGNSVHGATHLRALRVHSNAANRAMSTQPVWGMPSFRRNRQRAARLPPPTTPVRSRWPAPFNPAMPTTAPAAFAMWPCSGSCRRRSPPSGDTGSTAL